MAKKAIDVMITAFRDGFQSVYGARVLTPDFLPAVEAAVEAGIDHFEAGGGARFQSLYFYCNEDAFDMMDSFRRAAGPQANLQTLARGINVVGLDSQPSDIIRLHAQLFKKHGMTTIRNFDALNDVDNLDYSGRCIVEAGLQHEICITLMALPPGAKGAHTAEFYTQVLEQIQAAEIPFHSLCFKDASGTATPKTVYESVKRAKARLPEKIPVRFHTHETAGTSVACYLAALEAGATAIDCSLAPVSGGTCQPDIVVLWHALRESEYDLGIDIQKILKAEEVFKECLKDYEDLPEAARVEPLIPFSPMPGGALTANTQMMRDNHILEKFPQVIAHMGEVVARGGFGTSVTPVSQFYFQQAFNNVLIGPWKKIAEGYGKMVLGYFGHTPVPPDPEIVKLAQEQLGLAPTTRSPRLINDEDPDKGVEAAKKMLLQADLPVSDENIFIAATCKEKGIVFLKGEAKVNVRKRSPEQDSSKEEEAPTPKQPMFQEMPLKPHGLRSFHVYVNGEYFQVEVGEQDGNMIKGAPVQNHPGGQATPAAPRSAAPGLAAPTPTGIAPPPAQDSATRPPGPTPGQAAASGVPASAAQPVPVTAPLPGVVISYEKRVGEAVKSGDTIVILEAMKMNNHIESPCDGRIKEISSEVGRTVAKGDLLCLVDDS